MKNNFIPESLEDLKPIYFPSECDIGAELFLPVSTAANRFDCMSGYFSTAMLVELSLPLATIFINEGEKCRLLIGPDLEESDKLRLLSAFDEGEDMTPHVFKDVSELEDGIKKDAVNVMFGLIAEGRIELQIVLMKKGIFHTKAWLFDVPQGTVAIHGSSNATKGGLVRNFEQMAVSKSWVGKDSFIVTEEIKERFDGFWERCRDDSIVLPLNKASLKAISKVSKSELVYESADKILSYYEKAGQEFFLKTPRWLNYEEGEYAHQGEAIRSWMKTNKGILAIATGGGKTLTSLVCMAKAFSLEKKALVVIAVPKVPLIDQWCEDVERFGVSPINTSGMGTVDIIFKLNEARWMMRGRDGHAVVVITHDSLKNEKVQSVISKFKCPIGLVADEVHNLGTVDFNATSLSSVQVVVGLSATPVRQYDPEGTALLFSFFGDTVYEFGLSEAIGKCLVPFNYYPHLVQLEEEEVDAWLEINDEIKRMGWKFSEEGSNPALELLLIKRRRILECAENKLLKMKEILSKQGRDEISKTLIFCTDKDPAQLVEVNKYLLERGISFHQVTSEETGRRDKMRAIRDEFSTGVLSVLTSKRVLDEGFNVPQIETAYLLSSNTVRRQWIQRLGRTLRLSPSTNKVVAYIHDFVVVPPMDQPLDLDAKKIIKSEFDRVEFFTDLSLNSTEHGGGSDVMGELINMVVEK